MNVNKTVTMVVGLVVGVLLIAGVVAPVIADSVNDDTGDGEEHTNEGIFYYTWAKEGSSVDLYIVGYDTSSGTFFLSFEDPVENPDADSWEFMMCDMLYGEGYSIGGTYGGGLKYLWFVYDNGEETINCYPHLHLQGTTVTLTPNDDSSDLVLPNVLAYTSPSGDLVMNFTGITDDGVDLYEPYVGNEQFICALLGPTVYGPDFGYGTVNGFPITRWLDPTGTESINAEFSTADGKISEVILNEGGTSRTISVANPDFGEIVAFMIVPVTVGGSGGSGISPTLATILSVIPLILTVGLVIGAIGFLRMKN